MRKYSVFTVLLVLLLLAPPGAEAAALTFGAWIPYWKEAVAAPEMQAHLKSVSEISPFSFDVQPNGTLKDRMQIGQAPWSDLIAAARKAKVRIYPTIAWSDGDAIHRILSSSTLRAAHIRNIMALANEPDYAGVDIDYEGKKTETMPYFSLFLKDLSRQLHAGRMKLSCTIEARTPLASRFQTVPKTVAYANDFKAINSYCDEVRIMAYDQRNVDIKLSGTKGAEDFYYPVSDADWVKKVIQEAVKTISPKKIMLGVANYGHEYSVDARGYTRVRSLTYADFQALAQALGIKPARNSAGELGFTFMPSPATLALITVSTTPDNPGMAGSTSTMHFASLSDSAAIAAKVKLAKTYGLRGVMLFKVDGESDPAMWSKLK